MLMLILLFNETNFYLEYSTNTRKIKMHMQEVPILSIIIEKWKILLRSSILMIKTFELKNIYIT